MLGTVPREVKEYTTLPSLFYVRGTGCLLLCWSSELLQPAWRSDEYNKMVVNCREIS